MGIWEETNEEKDMDVEDSIFDEEAAAIKVDTVEAEEEKDMDSEDTIVATIVDTVVAEAEELRKDDGAIDGSDPLSSTGSEIEAEELTVVEEAEVDPEDNFDED